MAQAYGAYHSHYPKYFANQQAMFEAIVAQVRKITAQTCIDLVIPRERRSRTCGPRR